MWKALSLLSWEAYRVQDSLAYRRVLSTQALYTAILVLSVSMLLFHTLWDSLARVVEALPILLLISVCICDGGAKVCELADNF